LTGRAGGRGYAIDSGAETNTSTPKSILQERAAKDRLKKKVAETKATKLTKPQHIAVRKTNGPGEYSTMRPISDVGKRDELGVDNITRGGDITQGKYITRYEDITQIKADAPFDEPSKNDNTMLQNFAYESIGAAKVNGSPQRSPQRSKPKRSPLSDVIRVTQQNRSAYADNDGSLSEFTNQSEMSTTNNDSAISTDASQLSSKASLASDRGRKTNLRRKNNQPEPTAPTTEEEDIIEVIGSFAADAGCQVFEAFESIANMIAGTDEYANAKTNNVPFDEDVAIEVEYVEKK